MVRHGRAAAGWDTHVDPALDDIGRSQALAVADRLAPLGAQPIVTSPLLRCQQTAGVLAARWGVTPAVEAAVAEIPSPDGVPMEDRVAWLRQAMRGCWADLGPRYQEYRGAITAWVAARDTDTVVFSHFVAINAVIGAVTGEDRLVIASLDNCSVTTFEVQGSGAVHLVEVGGEADTLIR